MNVKYRVRLTNERVVGPFSEAEVVELFQKKHINGNEFCQHFPIGEWKSLSKFPNIYDQIQKLKIVTTEVETSPDQKIERIENASDAFSTSTYVVENNKNNSETINPNATRIQKKDEQTILGGKNFKEFKFQQGAKVDVDYVELEKNHRINNLKLPELDEGMEKTVHINTKRSKKHVDKTIVVKSDLKTKIIDMCVLNIDEEKAEKAQAEEAERRNKMLVRLTPQEIDPKTAKQIAEGQTQFIDLKEVLPKINAQLKSSEIELDNLAKIQENEEIHRQKEEYDKKVQERLASIKEDEVVVKDWRGNVKEIKPKKKGMSWIVGLAFLALFYNLFYPDEAPKKIPPTYLTVEFPVTKEFENIAMAKEELLKGRSLYNENHYLKRVLAAKNLVSSVQYKFNENPALGELILLYSELMENTQNEKLSANTIYKLLTVSEKDVLHDVNLATGAAIFYGKIGKPQTGILTIKNYLRVGSKPSVKLLAAYLDVLIKGNELKEARDVYEKLLAAPKKPFEVYIPIAKFLENDEKIAEAQVAIEEGLKFFPKNATLLLKYANLLLKQQSFEKFEEVLGKIKSTEFEYSPKNYAEYLKYLGMNSAVKNKNKEAALLFKKSLEIREDEELRMRLAELDISGNKMSQQLILDSKIYSLLKRAREEIKNKNWEQAAIISSEAVDSDPTNVPAIIVLSDLQLQRGLFEAAIHTLLSVRDKNPNNFQITTLLIQVHLKAFKLDESQKLLVEASQTKYINNPEYFALYGQFFELKQNIVFAVKYYEESLKRNPLDDKLLFKLANIYFKNKQFADAKKKLTSALFLDPKNTEYLSLYAMILNEQDGSDVAIGYVRDLMVDIGEDPKLLSTITSIYFKSGQVNEFKNYYKKIQQLPKKDEGFYEFLISAAKLEESYEDFENYSKELIKINPGNLKTRMNLAEFYIDKKRLPEAINELQEIKDKLPSYPKVHFMLAKVYLAQGDMKNAKEMASLELKLNPSLDSAYFIMGEVYRQNKEYREAVANFEKAISKNGKSLESIMALAWVRLNQNLASEALDLYTRAVKLDPINPEVHKQLGYTYKALGQRAVAKENFENYLKLNPAAADKPQIDQIIRTLK